MKVAAAAIAAPRTIDEGIGIIGPIPHGDGDGWGPLREEVVSTQSSMNRHRNIQRRDASYGV